MKHKLLYSPLAQKDLDEIWDYIVSDLCNPIAAESTVNKIMDDIDCLADFPKMGQTLSSITNTVTDYRYIVSGNYMAFYRLYDEIVYIVRILYGRRNYMRILFEENTEKTFPQ